MAKKTTKKYVKITAEQKPGKGRQLLSVIGVLFLLIVIGVFWAFPRSLSLDVSDTYDKETVEGKAKEIVTFFNEEDYEAIQAVSYDALAEAMTKEKIDQAKADFSKDWGEFVSFGEILSTEIKQMGKSNAAVQVNAEYENVSIAYTLSFDEDLKLAGFGME